MKKSKLISLWGGGVSLIALLMLFFLLSCSKEESVEKNKYIEDYEVSINHAISVANKFCLTKTFSKEIKPSINFHKSGIKRIVKQVFELKDNNGDIAIYAITFDPIGFVLISATKKEFPILAHSAINKLDLINQPKGLNKWLNFRILRIKELKESQLKIPDYINREWESYYGHPDWEDPNEGDPDPPTETSVGPIMNVTWGQGRFYNSLLPDMGCSKEDLGGKPPVGCLAVAMGQIMKGGEFDEIFGYINGHAWVCEGYDFGPNNDYLKFYMNWGDDGTSNAWFSYNEL